MAGPECGARALHPWEQVRAKQAAMNQMTEDAQREPTGAAVPIGGGGPLVRPSRSVLERLERIEDDLDNRARRGAEMEQGLAGYLQTLEARIASLEGQLRG